MTTYNIENMRVVRAKGKVAEANPDRFATVYGTFFSEDGAQMSFTSKPITFDEAIDPETVIDLTSGILTLTGKTRGRSAYESISQDDLEAELDSLRAK